jgi:hypothetical protein
MTSSLTDQELREIAATRFSLLATGAALRQMSVDASGREQVDAETEHLCQRNEELAAEFQDLYDRAHTGVTRGEVRRGLRAIARVIAACVACAVGYAAWVGAQTPVVWLWPTLLALALIAIVPAALPSRVLEGVKGSIATGGTIMFLGVVCMAAYFLMSAAQLSLL